MATASQIKVLEVIAETRQASPAQIVLAWLSSLDRVFPIVKAGTLDHLKENAAAMDLVLAPEEIAAISEVWLEEVKEVSPGKIRLRGNSQRKPYVTMEEALENRLDLIPSPEDLAQSMKRFGLKFPIRVIPAFVDNDPFDYVIDSYDPFDQVKKYWAWQNSVSWGRHSNLYFKESSMELNG